jgi:hypothetical protein
VRLAERLVEERNRHFFTERLAFLPSSRLWAGLQIASNVNGAEPVVALADNPIDVN